MLQNVVRRWRTAVLIGQPGAVMRLCMSHYLVLAAGVLALAAANLFVRLNQEVITDWDEALYAITAAELLHSKQWVATTFLGELDYYNSKPPLNAWLIAFAFETFGAHPLSLRIASALSAWITVLVLMEWTRRRFDPLVALLAGLVLSTSFGFIYVHSGRSGNADALFTLLLLLLVITLHGERSRPWLRAWLGPILAFQFLLKGMAVLMPLALVAAVLATRSRDGRDTKLPTLAACLLFLVPCGAWAVARWSVDGTAFFDAMWRNDLVRIALEPLDGHGGSPFFYLDVLQKHHYDWLAAAAVAVVLAPTAWLRARARRLVPHKGTSDTTIVLAAWAAVCLLIPTIMRTKLPWYLNPFYPLFALGTAWILAQGLSQYGGRTALRGRVVAVVLMAAFAVAELKLVAYSFRNRDIERSVQGLLMAERGRIEWSRVFKTQWSHADGFVLQVITRADQALAADVADFIEKSQPGEFLVGVPGLEHPGLSHVRSLGTHALYQRTPLSSLDSRGS